MFGSWFSPNLVPVPEGPIVQTGLNVLFHGGGGIIIGEGHIIVPSCNVRLVPGSQGKHKLSLYPTIV